MPWQSTPDGTCGLGKRRGRADGSHRGQSKCHGKIRLGDKQLIHVTSPWTDNRPEGPKNGLQLCATSLLSISSGSADLLREVCHDSVSDWAGSATTQRGTR